MEKTSKKLLAVFLCLVLAFCSLPVFAYATLTEDINVYDSTIWLVPPEGKIKSCETAEIPEQYGTSNYPDASCLNITLTDVADDESFTFNMRSDARKGRGDFNSTSKYLSTVGFTYAQREALYGDDSFLTQLSENEASLFLSEKTYEIPVTLEDGAAWVIVYYYTYSWRDCQRDENVFQPPIALVLHFQKDGAGGNPPGPAGEIEDDVLIKLVPEFGQLENENALYHALSNSSYGTRYSAYLIVPKGKSTVNATLTFIGNDYTVTVNGVKQGAISENNKLEVTLNAAPKSAPNELSDDSVNEIKVYQNNKEKVYTIWAVNQRFDDLPDAVTGYLCIGSQYTNFLTGDAYGTRAVRSLVGSNFAMAGEACGPVSTGNFGGYITYYYKDAITDDPNNPYGIDFITFGNSVEGSNEFGEPGQVWVSEDGNTWYALAGGMHYEDYADWDYSITYTSINNGYGTSWTDSQGNSGELNFWYPLPELYPLHSFAEGEEESISLSGIYFNAAGETNEFGNVRPPFAGFGYTDMGARGTTLNEETGEWGLTSSGGPETLEDYEAWARNIAGNPYLPVQYNEKGRIFSNVTDGMDLAWAVDAEGQPVDVSGMQFHYVKIVTASNIDAGAIGEKSTEVNMVRVAQANDEPVGKTDAPASITIDGAEVDLAADTLSAVVDGPFKVAVDAPEGTNIYINNNCAAEAQFDQLPLHKIVRVIVQQGEKEPAIYVINLTETDEPSPTAVLTLDAGGGTVNGADVWSCRFDAQMAGEPLPEPTAPNSGLEFSGWYSGQKLYTGYPDEVRDITLVAYWQESGEEPEEPEQIEVTFRLIGSTLAGDEIDLSDGDYKGAEYVTWIPTTTYKMNEGDTVADLIIKACKGAGIKQQGAAQGYVSSVWAPGSLGGYELAQFTNGPRSGWLYTIDGSHPTQGITEQKLEDGDEVILHYADDYAWEVEDWGAIGGAGWPQQSDPNNNFWDAWLEAEDVAPESGDEPDTPSTPSTPPAEKKTFEDVEKGSWYAEAVNWAVENGITTGKTETLFAPDEPCTRAQAVTFLWRAAGEPKPTAAENPFTDVEAGSYYCEAVLWAVEKGITNGVSATEFAPDAKCTRAQIVTFLWRAAGKPQAAAESPFEDVAADSYYTAAVAWAVDKGITTGVSKTQFAPDNPCTRAQIVTFLWREKAE